VELAAPEVAAAAAVSAMEVATASATAPDVAAAATGADSAAATSADSAAATAADSTAAAAATAALRQKSKVAAGVRRSSARALILAKRRDSDGADVLRSPDPAVAELEISWASEEREETDWMEKEPEGEVEEQEPYHLLPELKELKEDAEVPESKKELAGKVEEPEGEEKELETEPEPSLPEPEPPLPEQDEEEREQEFQLMMEKINSTLSRALERGQRRRRRR
jgi:hypothetical protein